MIKVLWAVKNGHPLWLEEVITDEEELFEEAKEWAIKQGYSHFRISEIDNSKPYFIGTIDKGGLYEDNTGALKADKKCKLYRLLWQKTLELL